MSLLLPGLSVLQILRPVATPEWLSPMVMPWPVITEQEKLEAVRLALKGFQEFAAVHGDETALTSVSLDQISKDFSESRLRIQIELKQNAEAVDEWERQLLEAAVFLEMARDLDERELDVEAGIARMDNLEGEFREILGISIDERLEDPLETISHPLRSDKTGFFYMLPKRMESWFRLLSVRMPPACPVLVTTEPVVEELIEWFRGKNGTTGNMPEPNRIPLASIPAMDGLAAGEFLSLVSDPEASNLLTSYWQGLEKIILSPGDPASREALSEKVDALDDFFRHHCREIGHSGEGTVSSELVLGDLLSWDIILKDSGQIEGAAALAGATLPGEPLKVLVWRS